MSTTTGTASPYVEIIKAISDRLCTFPRTAGLDNLVGLFKGKWKALKARVELHISRVICVSSSLYLTSLVLTHFIERKNRVFSADRYLFGYRAPSYLTF